MTETLLAFGALLALAFARIPIAFAMLIVGAGGFALERGVPAALDQLAQTTFAAGINYELSVVPLFILMGNLVAAVAIDDPQMAPKPAHATTVDIASPPRQWPMKV